MKLNDVVSLDPRQGGDGGPAGRDPDGRQRDEDLRHHPGQDRVEGQRGPRRDHRGRQEARRHAAEDRRASTCPVSTWTWNGPATGTTTSGAPPATCAKILDEFKAKGADAVVLDLRRNGGGSLTEAINLTGLFIDAGPRGPGEGRRRPGPAIRRHGTRHGLEAGRWSC